VIFNERHLGHVLLSYVNYYHRTRTHLSLDKNCRIARTLAHSCYPGSGESSPYRKSVACITAPNVSPPDQYHFLFANVARLLFQVV
jgi:hypothetical protein